jgi:hypothetical protein
MLDQTSLPQRLSEGADQLDSELTSDKEPHDKTREGDVGLSPYRDIRTIVRILAVVGLLIGIAILYLGLSSTYECPAQIVGQPSNCSNPSQIEVDAGIVIIITSVIGVAGSFLWPKPPHER